MTQPPVTQNIDIKSNGSLFDRTLNVIHALGALLTIVVIVGGALLTLYNNERQDNWVLNQQMAQLQPLVNWKPQVELRLAAVESQGRDITDIKASLASILSTLTDMKIQDKGILDRLQDLENNRRAR